MKSTPKRVLVLLALFLVSFSVGFAQDDTDTDTDDARVARISALVGEATVKRIDSEDWEKTVRDLPVVEGDVYLTPEDSRLEIQLDRSNFIRLDQNSELKLTFLGEDGIALSLSKGSLGVSLSKFDFETNYLEIDAPKSTITIQKDGVYRIDAGDVDAQAVSVFVADGGQARVYSNDAGFTLRDGQSSRLFLDGALAGQWDRSNVRSSRDGFDIWMSRREDTIASWTNSSDDDDVDDDYQYVDDDVYGADNLSNYGSWTYTSDYGHIWRPHRRSIAGYNSWSPYRYGQWRWVPYYGWTWINDEPWGWATYHSGRWIFYRGAWAWSPHRRYRTSRSWWRPALVAFSYIGRNVCWYPLTYGSRYNYYNRRFRNRWKRKKRRRANRRAERRRSNPTRNTVPQANIDRAGRNRTPPFRRVPPSGVVTTDTSAFGRGRTGIRRPPLSVARRALDKRRTTNTPPLLPDIKDLNGKLGKGVKPTRAVTRRAPVRTGVVTRTSTTPLEDKLKREKMRGNRTTVRRTGTRTPGIFDRTRTKKTERTNRTGTRTTRRTTTKRTVTNSPPVRRTETKRKTTTTRSTQTRRTTPKRTSPPARRSTPVKRRETRKPPVRRSQPKRTTPTRKSPPVRRSQPKRSAPKSRSAPVRRSQPKRSAPKKTSPKRSSPPKSKARTKTKS